MSDHSENKKKRTVVITEQQQNLHVDAKAFVRKAHNGTLHFLSAPPLP